MPNAEFEEVVDGFPVVQALFAYRVGLCCPLGKLPTIRLMSRVAIHQRLRKLTIDARRRSTGSQNCVPVKLPGVVLSAFEHRLDRTARTHLSFIGAPESDRLP